MSSGTAPAAPADPTPPPRVRLSPEEAVRIGLEHDNAVRAARDRADRASAVYQETMGNLGPRVRYDYSYFRGSNHLTSTFLGLRLSAASEAKHTLGLHQTLFAGGEGVARARSAKASRAAANFDFSAEAASRALDIRLAYLQAVLAESELAVRNESLGLAKVAVENIENRFRFGAMAKVDVLRGRVFLGNAETAVVAAKTREQEARLTLMKEMGVIGGNDEAAVAAAELATGLEVADDSESVESLVALAKSRRPELSAAALRVAAADSEIRRMRARYLPSVGFDTGLQALTSGEINVFDDASRQRSGWYYQLQGSVPIFDSFQTRSQVRQAKADRRLAVDAAAALAQSIEHQVRTAYADLRNAREAVQIADGLVGLAKEAFSISERQLEVGSETVLALMQTKDDLDRAQLGAVRARYDYNVARLQLSHACGRLAERPDDAPTPDPTHARPRP